MTYNAEENRELVNAIIIDNIKSSIIKENTPTVNGRINDSREGVRSNYRLSSPIHKNLYKYIDETKFKKVIREAKKSRKDKAAIAEARQLFVDTINRPEFAVIMREDFSLDDEESNIGYCQIIAQVITGIGVDDSNIGIPDKIWAEPMPEQNVGMTAKEEFDATLLPCIDLTKDTEDNWLIKGLIGLNPDNIEQMLEVSSFDKLDRLSEFTGTATNWVLGFKNEHAYVNDKKNVNSKIKQTKKDLGKAVKSQAGYQQTLNNMANYKAQVIQALSNNIGHLKSNNILQNRIDLWSQATVYQTTNHVLGRKVVTTTPAALLEMNNNRLSSAIRRATPHSQLLPAGIAKSASALGGVSAPIAIDFQQTQVANPVATSLYNDAARGDMYSKLVITTYVDKDSSIASKYVNTSIERLSSDTKQQQQNIDTLQKQVASLEGNLKDIDRSYASLERRSAGQAGILSAAIALFQLRSLWSSSSPSKMTQRGDRLAKEFMTGYASSTLALTTASLDVVNAGMQMKVARSVWIARLSLSIGVLGAVGAGFEIYSLNIARERHIESKSGVSRRATNIAMVSAGTAGVAGLGYGTLLFFGVGAFALPWLGAIMAVAWGISFIAQWVAHSYDKSNILPIHYWLDAGVFGKREMLDVNDYPNNPFNNSAKKIAPMSDLKQDLHAYTLALTEIQLKPKFETRLKAFNEVLSGQVIVNISQYQDHSELVVEYIGISNQELGLDRKVFSIEMLKRQNKAITTKHGVQVTLDIPKTSHYKEKYIGSDKDGTLSSNKQAQMQQASQKAKNNLSNQIEQLRVVILYSLNPSVHPHYQLRTTVTS